MYNFKKYSSKSFNFWNMQNKFIKKKSNKFISNKTKTFEKVLNQNKTFEKGLDQNETFEKVLNQNENNIHDFSKIDALMKKSKQFISFKNNLSFNNEQTLDELLDETLLLIICTKIVYSTKRFDKNISKNFWQ